MAFRFSLENVLRLLESLERQEEQKLMQASQHAAKARRELDDAGRYFEETQRLWRTEAGSANLGPALWLAGLVEAGYLRLRRNLQVSLQEAEAKLAAQIVRYREHRRKREIFDSLRRRHRAAYDSERTRRQQQMVDEVFLSRLRFPPGGNLPGA